MSRLRDGLLLVGAGGPPPDAAAAALSAFFLLSAAAMLDVVIFSAAAITCTKQRLINRLEFLLCHFDLQLTPAPGPVAECPSTLRYSRFSSETVGILTSNLIVL